MANVKGYIGDDNLAFLTELIHTEFQTRPTVDEMNKAIAAAKTGRFEKVESLPATGEDGIIYLIPSTTPSETNAYDEYYWDSDSEKYEYLGTTAIDLTDYLKAEDVAAMSNEEIQTIWDSVFGAVEE